MASFSPSEKCYATGIYPEQDLTMTEPFTARQVRDHASADDYIGAWRKVLRAFADRLEADEKAVPVRQFRVVPKGSTWTDVKDDEIWGVVMTHPESYETRILYTHPAPADAERLAEALRACALNWQEIAAATWRSYSVSASNVDKASAIAHMHCAQDIRKALAAHCAQAQPPAARVPGVSAQAHEKAQAALAALDCEHDWQVMRERAEKAEAELAESRETIKRLNRRVQVAEAGVAEKVKASTPGSLGRALANAAASKAEAELAALKARIAGAPTLVYGRDDWRNESLIGKRVALVSVESERAGAPA